MHRLFAILSFLVLSTGVVSAQVVDPSRPFSVVVALQDLGYRADLESDSSGDPKIRSSIEGVNYSFWFYGCTNNQNCTGWNMSAGFDLENGLSMYKVNQWNRTKLIGRVYLDDQNDPFIDYYVVARGGLDRVTFERVMARWGVAITQFKEHINW